MPLDHLDDDALLSIMGVLTMRALASFERAYRRAYLADTANLWRAHWVLTGATRRNVVSRVRDTSRVITPSLTSTWSREEHTLLLEMCYDGALLRSNRYAYLGSQFAGYGLTRTASAIKGAVERMRRCTVGHRFLSWDGSLERDFAHTSGTWALRAPSDSAAELRRRYKLAIAIGVTVPLHSGWFCMKKTPPWFLDCSSPADVFSQERFLRMQFDRTDTVSDVRVEKYIILLGYIEGVLHFSGAKLPPRRILDETVFGMAALGSTILKDYENCVQRKTPNEFVAKLKTLTERVLAGYAHSLAP